MPRPARSRPPQFLVDFATIWIIGVSIRAGLFGAIATAPTSAPPLGAVEHAGLLSIRLLASVPAALIFAACFGTMRAAARLPRGFARFATAACWLLSLAFALMLCSSWAGFYATGQFMGTEAIALALSSPTLLIGHVVEMESIVLAVVPALALLLVLLLRYGSRWSERLSPARARAIAVGVPIILACAGVVASMGDVESERVAPAAARVAAHVAAHVTAGGSESEHQLFLAAATDRSGAIARLLVEAVQHMTTATLRAARWAATGDRGRRVISPAEYASAVPPSSAPHMSVIVVLVESLRRDELVAEGGARTVLPSLEALARDATLYTNVVTPAAQSDYATTSILSSQYPLRNLTFRPFPDSIPYPRVLPYDIFRQFHYRTAIFSSQNEHWAGMYNFLQTGQVEHFLHAETFKGPTFSANSDRGLHDWIEKTGHAGKIDDSSTVDEAIAWTDSIAPTAPFFAYINLQSSHNPYLLMRPFAPRFGSGHVSFPILFDHYPADSAQAVRDLYDNSLAYADQQLARLFDALKRSGRWDSTIIAVLGDHGEAFYEHGFGAHGGELFSEVTHVPLVIRVPGRGPAVDTLPASSIDVMPTILGILKLPPHPGYQGVDMADHAARTDRPLISLTQTGLADEVSVEQDRWKVMFDLRHSVVRLYDLTNDPHETRDVGNQYPAQRDALIGTIAAWWARQIGYYSKLPAIPEFYAPPAPISVPLAPPLTRVASGR